LGPRKLRTSDGQASDAESLPPLREGKGDIRNSLGKLNGQANRFSADWASCRDSRVEVWRGGLGSAYRFPALSCAGASLAPPCSVSTPRSSNRAGGFPAPGFRTRLYFICCFTRSPTNDCRYGRWSWYNPSSWYRYWSWNRFFPFPGTLNFAHNH